jgi:hypothetical protein
VLLLACAAGSCGDNPADSGSLKGTLTLVVALTDQDGARLADNSDVTATLDGTTRSATSDADGFLSFNDLPAGIYNITLTKPGFSTFKIFGAQFVGGGTAYIRDVFITEIPNFAIEQFRAAIDTSASFGSDYVNVAGTISNPAPESNDRLLRVFFDTSSTVSPSRFLNAGSVPITAGHEDFQRLISVTGLRKAGVAKGTRVYVVAFPSSVWTLGYFDPAKRKWVEANLAPQGSPAASFIMP